MKGQDATVASVDDARTLTLSDGRVLRLAGIEVPGASSASPPAGSIAGRARAELSSILSGQSLSLAYVGTRIDRHGRVSAFLMVDGERSAQEALVEAGLARVAPTGDARLCMARLLAAEARARAGQHGLWRDPAFAIVQAGDLAALARLEGRFGVVEGTVKNASNIGGRLYLNFGDDRRTDFTVTVTPADARLFKGGSWERRKTSLPALAGQKLRMRGFLDRYNGPEMRLSVPEQVEFLDKGPNEPGMSPAHDDRHSTPTREPRP